MSFIHVVLETLRRSADHYAETAQATIALITKLDTATHLAGRSERSFRMRVEGFEVDAVARLQRIANDATEACETLTRRANAFAEADEARQAGLTRIAAEMVVLTDLGISVPPLPDWLEDGECPPGIPPGVWARLPLEDRLARLEAAREAFAQWFQEKVDDGTIGQARLEEFDDLIRGERKLWVSYDSTLSFRSGPGVGYGRVDGIVLAKGTVVEWTGREQNGWYEVKYTDDKGRTRVGWVAKEYLEDYAYVDPAYNPANPEAQHPFDLLEPGAYNPEDRNVMQHFDQLNENGVSLGFPQQVNYHDYLDQYRLNDEALTNVPVDRNYSNRCGDFVLSAITGQDVGDVHDIWLTNPMYQSE